MSNPVPSPDEMAARYAAHCTNVAIEQTRIMVNTLASMTHMTQQEAMTVLDTIVRLDTQGFRSEYFLNRLTAPEAKSSAS